MARIEGIARIKRIATIAVTVGVEKAKKKMARISRATGIYRMAQIVRISRMAIILRKARISIIAFFDLRTCFSDWSLY